MMHRSSRETPPTRADERNGPKPSPDTATYEKATSTMPHPGPQLMRAALAAAERGWHIFPITPMSKKPPAFPAHNEERCDGTDPWCRNGHVKWEQRATADPTRIGRAWSKAPYNIGLAPGRSGLVVIDLDVPKAGEQPPGRWARPGIRNGADVLAALCEEHGQEFPRETFTVRTGSGGRHLYFIAPSGARLRNTAGELGWKIDTRGHGGYVLAPGSIVRLPGGAGRYEIVNDRPPVPLPGWLGSLLDTPRGSSPSLACPKDRSERARDTDRYVTAALKGEVERVTGAVEGGRNAALNKAAYHLGQLIPAGALDDATVEQELYAAASPHFGVGSPPFTSAGALATIRSAIAAGKRKPRPAVSRHGVTA